MKGIYKFSWNCGRQGDVEGCFVATSPKEARDKAWNIFINRKKTRKLFGLSESEVSND